eukprot:5768805-Prymnesium_polylepis.1
MLELAAFARAARVAETLAEICAASATSTSPSWRLCLSVPPLLIVHAIAQKEVATATAARNIRPSRELFWRVRPPRGEGGERDIARRSAAGVSSS